MQNPSSTFRCTLQALFASAAFVGLGLLALMHPAGWIYLILNLAVVSLVAYACVSVW